MKRGRRQYTRCPDCGRILFRDKDNKLPAHKVPEPTPSGLRPGITPSARLTPKDAPWCGGIGK